MNGNHHPQVIQVMANAMMRDCEALELVFDYAEDAIDCARAAVEYVNGREEKEERGCRRRRGPIYRRPSGRYEKENE